VEEAVSVPNLTKRLLQLRELLLEVQYCAREVVAELTTERAEHDQTRNQLMACQVAKEQTERAMDAWKERAERARAAVCEDCNGGPLEEECSNAGSSSWCYCFTALADDPPEEVKP